jgi:hypothetical protein
MIQKQKKTKRKKKKYEFIFELYQHFDQGKIGLNIISAFAEQRATAHGPHYMIALQIPNRIKELGEYYFKLGLLEIFSSQSVQDLPTTHFFC